MFCFCLFVHSIFQYAGIFKPLSKNHRKKGEKFNTPWCQTCVYMYVFVWSQRYRNKLINTKSCHGHITIHYVCAILRCFFISLSRFSSLSFVPSPFLLFSLLFLLLTYFSSMFLWSFDRTIYSQIFLVHTFSHNYSIKASMMELRYVLFISKFFRIILNECIIKIVSSD